MVWAKEIYNKLVLTISSKYPRLGVCRAFDASLISDYFEEQEWLIGFIYTRIRKYFQWAMIWRKLWLKFSWKRWAKPTGNTGRLWSTEIVLPITGKRKYYPLQNKFDEFMDTPNTKQIIRLDDISQNLKKYLLDCEHKKMTITRSRTRARFRFKPRKRPMWATTSMKAIIASAKWANRF